MKQYYDSTYSILRDINIALGGVDKQFDGCYSILLSILEIMGGGGKKEIVVNLPATINTETMSVDVEAELDTQTMSLNITNLEIVI